MSEIPSPSLLNKRYELSEKLGSGGMGSVFRATDRLTRTAVALKRVTALPENLSFASKADHKTDLRVALATEFRTLSSLRHPNIISVLDYGFDDQRQPYFTMEYLENATPLSSDSKDRAIAHLRRDDLIDGEQGRWRKLAFCGSGLASTVSWS